MGMPTEMVVECWVWYGLAITAVVVRFCSQYMVRKRNFTKDIPINDFLMILTVCTYTTAMVALFLYFRLASTVNLDDLTPEDNFVIGRKLGILNILAETSMQTTLWGNKCCLLVLYIRLALFGNHRKTWMIISTYIALAYVAVLVALYGGWCRPFSDYLVLQPQNMSCLTWEQYNKLQITMNLSTDSILLIIPVVLVSRLNMKIGKKILLVCLFSLGIFVMLAAILTKVAVFSNTIEPVWFVWCIREVSTAMLVGNLSLCMPIARTWWKLLFPGSGKSSDAESTTLGTSGGANSKLSTGGTTDLESRVGGNSFTV